MPTTARRMMTDRHDKPTTRGKRTYETAAFRPDELFEGAQAAEQIPCLTVLNGAQSGRIIEVKDRCVIGREDGVDVLIEDKGISRRHAQILRSTLGPMTLVDLGSRNGTWCNGAPVDSDGRVLREGDKIGIGAVILKYSTVDPIEHAFQQRQYESVTRDALTGCHNRKAFDERLPSELAFGLRHQRPVTLIMLDIDHFKRINDTWGHQAGDEVLRRVGIILRNATRSEDIVCRYGGEEFAVILREQDDAGAAILAERLRATIETTTFAYHGERIPVTASLGIATWAGGPADEYALVKAADEALYTAKLSGRNRVVQSDA